MWDDSLSMISGWGRKPVVIISLHSVPPKRGTQQRHIFRFKCATHASDVPDFPQILLFRLPSRHGLQRPDISGSRPVSGDDGPLPGSDPSHNVIHSSDDGDFWKAHHCILKVLCCLQRLHSLDTIKVSFPHAVICSLLLLTSITRSPLWPTSSLGTSERGTRTPHSSTSPTDVHCLMITKTLINMETKCLGTRGRWEEMLSYLVGRQRL